MGRRALACCALALVSCCGEEADYVRQYVGSVLDVVLQHGHSIAGGTNIDANGSNDPPPLIPTPTVDLFRRGLSGDETFADAALVSLRVTAYGGAAGTSHGSELAMGLGLYNAFEHLAILKVWANGSKYADWVEGGTYNAGLQTAIADFKTAVQRAYPAVTTIRWRRVTFLGTNEGSASGSAAQCNGMPALASTLRTQVVGYIGASLVQELVIRESINIASQPFLTEERAAQATIATNLGGFLVNTDDLITVATEQSDGRHPTGAGENAIGTRNAGIIASAL